MGPSLFFSLLVITVSFLPIFALTGESGRLFKPLAYTKTFSMAAASILAVTLVPVMMVAFLRGRIPGESRNPLNRLTMRLYHPALEAVLRFPKTVDYHRYHPGGRHHLSILPIGLGIHATPG